jgi:CBS domain-containing protein
MQVSDVMTCDVVGIDASQSVLAAAKVMAQNEVGALLVTDGGHLVGVVTERDLVVRAIAGGLDSARAFISDVMTRGVFSCLSDAPLWEAQQLMEAHSVGRLVAVDREGAVEGIISLEHLATAPERELAQPAPHLASQ